MRDNFIKEKIIVAILVFLYVAFLIRMVTDV